jgi:cell division protein FtsI/penicillin-binding protein 2
LNGAVRLRFAGRDAPRMRVLPFLVALLLVGLIQSAESAGTPARSKTGRTAAAKRKAAAKKVLPRVDPTDGDNVDGDDLTVRRAAVAALGWMNGSVVVAEPGTGRILTMVNQKLGLKSGFTPCSTIKLVTSLAALSERIIDRDSFLFTSRRVSYNLTTAIAHSNNPYFAMLGKELGYDRVTQYARMLGLGERAGLDIPGEQPGVWPDEAPKVGGMGMMTSFGEGILMTPLELAALLSAIANGGTMYYLQYPRTQAEIEQFAPKVKRELRLAPNGISDIKIGMRAAVDFGTGRRAGDPSEIILGKTGTCTDFRLASHMGWFGSFNDAGPRQIVVVVMLAAANKSVSGGVAAGVAGAIYRSLSEQRYFAMASGTRRDLPEILTTTPCCSR